MFSYPFPIKTVNSATACFNTTKEYGDSLCLTVSFLKRACPHGPVSCSKVFRSWFLWYGSCAIHTHKVPLSQCYWIGSPHASSEVRLGGLCVRVLETIVALRNSHNWRINGTVSPITATHLFKWIRIRSWRWSSWSRVLGSSLSSWCWGHKCCFWTLHVFEHLWVLMKNSGIV